VTLKKKICMVGQFAVGKTSLVRRFVDQIYDDRYLATVGVKIDRKDISVGSSPLTLMLWDLAGEDDVEQLKISHLRGASGYIVVVDGCRAASLTKALELQKRITGQLGELPFVLALNKADLRDQWEISGAAASQAGWSMFETSAKTGAGVQEMFAALAEKLLA
jgi:small GTP-binding protein